MTNHKLFQIIKKLPRKKFLAFCVYSNKMHDKNCDENKLLAYLKSISPNFEEKKLEKETAFKKAFKQTNFDEKRMNNAIAELGKRLQDYLLFQHIKNASFEKEYAMLKIYEELKADKLAKKQIKKLDATLEKSKSTDNWYWSNKIKAAHEDYYNPHLERIALEGERLKSILTDADNFYVLAKLKYACEFFSRTQVVEEEEVEIKFLDEIIACDWTKVSILHALYQSALEMIRNRDDDYFFKLKEGILTSTQHINPQDSYILLIYLNNHCAFRLKEGNLHFKGEVLKLFKYKSENNLLIANGYINEDLFTNIVDLSTVLGEISWAKAFLNSQKIHLHESYQTEVVNLCRGIILFREKYFEKAIPYFCKSYKQNSNSDIRARLLRIDCKYELTKNEGSEYILRECLNLETYISRESIINSTTQQSALSHIKVVKRLLSLLPDKIKLLSFLKEQKHIFYKSWLTEKIDELKG